VRPRLALFIRKEGGVNPTDFASFSFKSGGRRGEKKEKRGCFFFFFFFFWGPSIVEKKEGGGEEYRMLFWSLVTMLGEKKRGGGERAPRNQHIGFNANQPVKGRRKREEQGTVLVSAASTGKERGRFVAGGGGGEGERGKNPMISSPLQKKERGRNRTLRESIGEKEGGKKKKVLKGFSPRLFTGGGGNGKKIRPKPKSSPLSQEREGNGGEKKIPSSFLGGGKKRN